MPIGEPSVAETEASWVNPNAAEYVRRMEEYWRMRDEIADKREEIEKDRDAFNEVVRDVSKDHEEERLVLINKIEALEERRRALAQFEIGMDALATDPAVFTAKVASEELSDKFTQIQTEWRNTPAGSDEARALGNTLLEVKGQLSDANQHWGDLSYRAGQHRGEFWEEVNRLKAGKKESGR